MTIARHLLPGLRAEPLASYLAGLGLIRVPGEQADEGATAAWTPDRLAITTMVPSLPLWLADEYKPTPVLSPWNGGSGWRYGICTWNEAPCATSFSWSFM
jgi:CRISPR-associated protein Csx17